MTVLLIRLAGPLQSWGASSRFSRRETELRPTKSGVIGMIAAALGVGRQESLDRFRSLRFGIRVDQPGTLLSDYQTARNDKGIMMPVSTRYYLQDAVFLAGLESEETEKLQEFEKALHAPHYQLFLGRRSCPPSGPIETQIVEGDLTAALQSSPWKATARYQQRSLRRRAGVSPTIRAEIFVEPGPDDMAGAFIDTLEDEPVSFDPRNRVWRPRRIVHLEQDVIFQKVPGETGGPSPILDSDSFFTTVAKAGEAE